MLHYFQNNTVNTKTNKISYEKSENISAKIDPMFSIKENYFAYSKNDDDSDDGFEIISEAEAKIAKEQNVTFEQANKEFAELEYMARTLAYHPTNEMNKIDAGHEGLIIYYSIKNDTIELYARGTKDKASAYLNLDPEGPAYQEFMKNKNQIFEQINSACYKKNIKIIRIAGHSLGGSVAQLLTTEFLKAQIDNMNLVPPNNEQFPSKCRNNFKTIKTVELGIFNSAGVNAIAVNQANNAAKALKGHIRISSRVLRKSCDPVHQTGLNIFAGLSKEYVNLIFLKVDDIVKDPKKQAIAVSSAAAFGAIQGGILGALAGTFSANLSQKVKISKQQHASHNYRAKDGKQNNLYMYIANDTPNNIKKIEKELSKYSAVLNNRVTQTAQSFAYQHPQIATVSGVLAGATLLGTAAATYPTVLTAAAAGVAVNSATYLAANHLTPNISKHQLTK